MQQLGFHSVFARLFASVMLALILFAVAMVLLTQLVHDKDASIRSEVLATQILGQIDPFLQELNVSVSKENRLQARFMLAVVKKSFDIFDESLQAKMGLYDNQGKLLMQTDNSDLPLELPAMPSLLSRVFPSIVDTPPTQQAQVYSSTGYTLLYESRLPPKKPVLSAALNLFTGTLLLLLIMSCALWWIARSMTWRINQMSQQMGQLGDGDFSVRVNASGNDEIALLARGFNQAAQKIEHLINANNLLLAHASHELRTPITRIRLQIEMMDMLTEPLPSDNKAKFDKRAQAINRDLSGLNDLVESILLVSRLDAGHVMQQIETLDLYDLVNQERQHFSESTLIGEHIVIDGQPAMLTHLIRNLLTNAMLHGEPPVTILLYGVQSIDKADTVPDYLMQSLLSNSLLDYNNSDYSHYDDSFTEAEPSKPSEYGQVTDVATSNNQQAKDNRDKLKAESLESSIGIDILPAPVIYCNGETLTDDIDIIDNSDHSDAIDYSNDASAQSALASRSTASPSTLIDTVIYDDESINKNNSSNDSIKPNQTNDKSLVKAHKAETTKAPEDTTNIPRKESLFKKHLKKSKAEPMRPLPKYVVLAVIDEGEGIPEAKREEIFSPFVRLQQKKKGSGLGLSLVSQIVTAHQGRITTDTINGYTRFLVVLPVRHDPDYNYNDHDSHDLTG
ncbi:HAMP domain-containing protein [Psychrobacter sp. TAE2020]|uniref:ATP-binding protein n=1 Tax=Psychrobacter sp. TAE2020 TaxID=2846762 RepID=UPI001C0FD960|nr:ATP-binding protein [Psychrobacter sp. TAE2020]MBU5617532.1 HAMP domain-containing protein [Psychrobacter sp. TAE2020]